MFRFQVRYAGVSEVLFSKGRHRQTGRLYRCRARCVMESGIDSQATIDSSQAWSGRPDWQGQNHLLRRQHRRSSFLTHRDIHWHPSVGPLMMQTSMKLPIVVNTRVGMQLGTVTILLLHVFNSSHSSIIYSKQVIDILKQTRQRPFWPRAWVDVFSRLFG